MELEARLVLRAGQELLGGVEVALLEVSQVDLALVAHRPREEPRGEAEARADLEDALRAARAGQDLEEGAHLGADDGEARLLGALLHVAEDRILVHGTADEVRDVRLDVLRDQTAGAHYFLLHLIEESARTIARARSTADPTPKIAGITSEKARYFAS